MRPLAYAKCNMRSTHLIPCAALHTACLLLTCPALALVAATDLLAAVDPHCGDQRGK